VTSFRRAEGPVWIASYMKSGNTWMRLMMMHLLKPDAGQWTPDQQITVGTGPLPRANIDEASFIETALLSADEQDLLRPRLCDAEAREAADRCFFKTHDAYRLNRDGIPVHGTSSGQAALYLVRDPRDIALSLATFWNWTLQRTVSFMNDPEADLHGVPKHFSKQIFQKTQDWSSHVASWLEQDRVPVLPIRYEDLRAAPAIWLTRAAEFLGIGASPDQIRGAVEFTDFARLQREEARHGFAERFKPEIPFFRRAEPGEGRALLDPDLVASIEHAHGRLMDRLGYSRESGTAIAIAT